MKTRYVKDIKDLKFLKIAIDTHPVSGIQLEYLDKVNAIAALVLNEKGNKALLVKQYRPGCHKELLEVPAGLMENGEDPLESMCRELEEETGYTKKDYDIIYSNASPMIVSPGCSTESLYIFIVKLKNDSITPQALRLDEGEVLDNHWIDLNDIEKMTNDLKTIFCLYLYKNIKL